MAKPEVLKIYSEDIDMFEKIGYFSSRFRYPIILFWVVAVVLVTLLAPNLGDMTISDQTSFLSAKAPSIQAASLASKYFPEQSSSGSAVLVLYRPDGRVFDLPQVQPYIDDLTHWLENDADPSHTIIANVLSPADPNLTDRLTSQDGQVVIFNVGLIGSMENTATTNMLKVIQKHMENTPNGIEGYVTGGSAIAQDYKSSALASAEKTTLITVVLVIVILLTIYRSPVLPFVPLITIGIAYGISRGLVAWLALSGMKISSLTDVFMVVLLFGAGTDYCLFITSRFREYMADDYSGVEAVRGTIARVGETITSSAGTVIVGTIAMTFVELKMFANSGPSLALGVFVALLAGLTLTPALLAVLGRHAFWPGKPSHAGTRAVWGRLASWVARRPWLPLVLALIVLVPLAIYGLGHHTNFDLLADLPSSDPAKAGFKLLSDHFGAGEMQPQDVIMTGLPDGRSPQGIAAINALTQRLLILPGVADVRSLLLPAGKTSAEIGQLFQVDAQLAMMADGIQSLTAANNASASADQTSNGSLTSSMGAGSLGSIMTYLADLGEAFPDVTANPDYQAVVQTLGQLQNNFQTILYQLPVSSQLRLIGGNLTQALNANSSTNPWNTETGQVTMLRDYLTGLAQALPAVTQMDGYADALAAANELEGKMAELSQLMLLPNQLGMIAQLFEGISAQLETNPLALKPQEGQPSTAEQMDGLKSYLEELGAAFPELKATSDYAEVLAVVDQLSASSSSNMDLANAKQAIAALASGFRGLANTAAANQPEATFVPQTSIPGADAATLVGDVLAKMSAGLDTLANAVQAQMPEAKYVPDNVSPEALQSGTASLMADATALEGSLRSLAANFSQRSDGFFLPTSLVSGKNANDLTDMVNMYVSANGDAARLQVVLADEPYSDAAIDTVTLLRKTVKTADHGYISGGTAILNDLRDAMARDTRLVMVLVLGGIAVVMVLLLRSLVAPMYLILTILLSYASTLGITRLLFEGLLHTNLTWFVPFFIFILLMSLGMDYNIFLMGRVKEETADNGTRLGVQRAMERTGGIITSAGIIMAGTFAAMLSSSLVGLVQLAFAISIGVLLDTFIVRTTLVPAIAMLLGHWNWWPRKKA
jgi:RND superfamily putative drug exporter